jgi:hypothetical protein
LSVETASTVCVRCERRAARARFSAPITFVSTAWLGKYSHVGTCFIAAAWKTTSAFSTALITLSKSRTSPIQNSISSSKLW